jgi:hypothetical protein
MEDQRSRLERPAARICDRAQLASRLDKAVGQLRVELAARREADAKLEALRTLTMRVQDLVLGSTDEPSSLAASMSENSSGLCLGLNV